MSTSESSNCPNCRAELKSGLMSSNKMLSEAKTKVINEYHEPKSECYCGKCGKELYDKYRSKVISDTYKTTDKIQALIHSIPVISCHSPLHWDYDILQMVTGQSTTGTGVISEFTSSFTDLFGAQSGRYNNKLKAGENLCYAQLRKQTLDLGGNAVIATDIDYAELGAEKGMIMVCMSGTAIRLKNLEVLGANKSQLIAELIDAHERYIHLMQCNIEEQ